MCVCVRERERKRGADLILFLERGWGLWSLLSFLSARLPEGRNTAQRKRTEVLCCDVSLPQSMGAETPGHGCACLEPLRTF